MAVHAAVTAAVQYATAASIATITLDSPANRNALSAALVSELVAALEQAAGRDDVRAVVLTHTGSTFCAGNDLREASTADGAQVTTARLVALLRLIIELPKPVVARVDGHTRAGGIGLVCACDIAIGGPGATFAFTETRLGLAPAVISLTALARMPARAAVRYLLTGEVLDGPSAVAAGLLTEYAGDPDSALESVLDPLRSASPQGLAETKALVNAALRADFEARADTVQQQSARLFASAEAREGMRAFLEKRPPNWLA
jgi:enoyl-CoA hydratase